MITQQEVKSLFNYNPHTGILTNKIKRGSNGFKGAHVGSNCKEYLVTTINRKRYKVHRVIYLFIYGYIPQIVDHKDGNKQNNKIENLRPATPSENQRNKGISRNNTSGVKGVTWYKNCKLWRAQIRVNGKRIHLGYFKSIDRASVIMEEARKVHHKEFANNG